MVEGEQQEKGKKKVPPCAQQASLAYLFIFFSIPTFISIGHSVRTQSGCMKSEQKDTDKQVHSGLRTGQFGHFF